jgi:uncharacterized membrane protein
MNPMLPNQNMPNMMANIDISQNQNNTIDPMQGINIYKPMGGGTKLSDLVKNNEIVQHHTSQKTEHYSNGHSTGRPTQRQNTDRESDSGRYADESNRGLARSPARSSTRGSARGFAENSARGFAESSARGSYSDKSIKELADDVNNSLRALDNMEHYKKKKKRIEITETDKDEGGDNDTDQDTEAYSRKTKTYSRNTEAYSQDTSNTEIVDPDKITLETIDVEVDYLKFLTEFIILLTLYVILSQPFVISVMTNVISQLNPSDEGTVSMTGIVIYGLILAILFFITRRLIFSNM